MRFDWSMIFRSWRLGMVATRPWRLIPELDSFPDSECRGLVEGITGWRSLSLFVSFLIVAPVGITLTLLMSWLGEMVLPASVTNDPSATTLGRMVYTLVALFVFCVTLSAALTPYCLILRWAIGRRVGRVTCPTCRYFLLGLPVTSGRVVCPECGLSIKLADHGLRAEDIAVGERRRDVPDQASTATTSNKLSVVARFSRVATLAALGIAGAAYLVWVITGAGQAFVVFLLVLASASVVSLPQVLGTQARRRPPQAS